MNVFEQVVQVTVLWPRMLWLLATVPLLVSAYVWLGMRRRRALTQLSGLAIQPASGFGGRIGRTFAPLLFLLGLTALIAAISRPQANVMLPALHKDIILAVDTSGSMRATDIQPDRMSAARSAARAFVDGQPSNTRIGIVSIAGAASVVQSPTDNREELRQAIERLQPQRGTALGSGLYISLATLLPDAGIDLERLVHGRAWHWRGDLGKDKEKPKSVPVGSNRSAAIVLLSDGESNVGPEPLEAAKLAAEHGVRIYTIGVGSTEGAPIAYGGWSMRVRLDETVLKKIAATTHGEYYAASSAQALKNVYAHLSARLVIERTRTVEVTAFLVGVGVLLIVISALCSVMWFNRVL